VLLLPWGLDYFGIYFIHLLRYASSFEIKNDIFLKEAVLG